MNMLEQILATKRREIERRRAARPLRRIEREAAAVERRPRSLARGLRESGTGIIAEFKRRSPSKGCIHAGADPSVIVPGYERAGAAAVSILTDSDYFGGSLDDLASARECVSVPILRKDFTIDRYQICEARLYGADAVLLIAAALTPARTRELARYAHGLQLEVLLELHDERELDRLCDEADILGINNRDLSTFATDTEVSLRLGRLLPAERTKISESGLSSPDTIRELRAAGFDGFLMGENFMKRPDPAAALAELIERTGNR